ncbi:MAG: transposase [Tolypothrix carrinoi HA7290-LM1]|jgi:transposase|nr:transposase [Tolypothrix carrinoi HA7290-LM1]
MTEDAPQREHSLREVFNGLRYVVRTGGAWGYLPHDLPPWHTVYERSFAWMSKFRRLARDYERLAETLAGFHLIAFVMLMVKQFVEIRFQSA